MKSPIIPSRILALALPAVLAVPGWAGDSINNDITVKVPGKTLTWKLTLVSGQGSGDSIKIAPADGNAELKAPGDSATLKPGKVYTVTFNPNFGKDGSKYVVKLTDSFSMCKECTGTKTDQYVVFNVAKPVDTTFSSKASRKLTIKPDWKADYNLHISTGGGDEQNKVEGLFQDGTWNLGGDFGQGYF